MIALSREERAIFRARLARMPDPVHLLIFTDQERPHGAEARQLGRELRALSANVHLELHDVAANPLLAARYGIDETPVIALFTGGVYIEDTHIRCYGVPTGPVLQALVDGMLAVSRGRPVIAGPTDQRVQRLDRPVHLDVFVPAAYPADPRLLLRLQRIALLSPLISVAIVLAADFPEWAQRYDGDSAMRIVVNDAIALRETASEQQLLDALEAAARGEPEPLVQTPGAKVPRGAINGVASQGRASDGATRGRAESWPVVRVDPAAVSSR